MTCCWCASRYWRRIHGGRKSCREQYYMWHRLPVTLWPRHIVSGGSCKAHTTATACCTHRHRLMATTAHDFSSPNLFSTNHARLLLFRLLLLLWMLLVQLKMNSKCNILFSDGIRHRKNKILGWASILGYIVALCLWRRWASPLSSANIEHWEAVLHTHLRHEHHTTSSRNNMSSDERNEINDKKWAAAWNKDTRQDFIRRAKLSDVASGGAHTARNIENWQRTYYESPHVCVCERSTFLLAGSRKTYWDGD